MTVRIAFLAEPHLCAVPSRRNFLDLLERNVLDQLDTVKRRERGASTDRWSWKPGSFDKRPLLAAADLIADLAPEIDLFVLLGDLSTTGKAGDLEVAKRVFLDDSTEKYATVSQEPRFGGKGMRFHVIPGNHDRYQDDIGTPGGTLFDSYFKSVYAPRMGVSTVSVEKDGVSATIVSADFCHLPGTALNPIKRLGWGSVREAVLTELEHQTSEAKLLFSGAPVFWALHFSPSENVSSKLQLEDRELVIDAAVRHEVRHIFCGHTHMRTREVGTFPNIYSAGSVSACDSRSRHFLHICSVSKPGSDHVLDIQDLIFDEGSGEFVLNPLSDIA